MTKVKKGTITIGDKGSLTYNFRASQEVLDMHKAAKEAGVEFLTGVSIDGVSVGLDGDQVRIKQPGHPDILESFDDDEEGSVDVAGSWCEIL